MALSSESADVEYVVVGKELVEMAVDDLGQIEAEIEAAVAEGTGSLAELEFDAAGIEVAVVEQAVSTSILVVPSTLGLERQARQDFCRDEIFAADMASEAKAMVQAAFHFDTPAWEPSNFVMTFLVHATGHSECQKILYEADFEQFREVEAGEAGHPAHLFVGCLRTPPLVWVEEVVAHSDLSDLTGLHSQLSA